MSSFTLSEPYKTIFPRLSDLQARVGEEIGLSPWVELSQERINLFADATEDHQWIHVDPEKVKQSSPFPGPIAHGFLLLSLAPKFCYDTFFIEDAVMVLNYGLDRVRFPHIAPAGSRVRGRVQLLEFAPFTAGARLKVQVSVELEGVAKPACVAEAITQVYTTA